MPRFHEATAGTPTEVLDDYLIGHNAANDDRKYLTDDLCTTFLRNKYANVYVAAYGDTDHKKFADIEATEFASQVAIQAALDSLTAGGKVTLGPGLFNVNGPIRMKKDGSTIEGSAPGRHSATPPGTVIRAQSGFTATSAGVTSVRPAVIEVDNSADGGTTGDTVYNPTIRDLTIDVNDVASIRGIMWMAKEGKLDNVKIYGAGTSVGGLHTRGYTAGDVYNNIFDSVWVRQCGAYGLHVDQVASDQIFSNCVFANNTGAGIYFPGGGAGSRFKNCNIYGNLHAILFESIARLQFSNCSFNNSQQHGILFDCDVGNVSKIAFSNCEWRNNGLAGADSYDNVHFKSSAGTKATEIGITGGSMEDGNNGLSIRYAIGKSGTTAAAVTQLFVVGCVMAASSDFVAFHNLTADNLYRFVGCGYMPDENTTGI